MHGLRSWSSFAAVLVLGSSPLNASPFPLQCQARAAYSGNSPPIQVSFEALFEGGQAPHGFHWDFGDGASSTEQNPPHTYTESGIYRTILTVIDSDLPQNVCRDTVMLYIGVFVDPFCSASASTTWGAHPLTVEFEAHPALVGDPPPYTWSWTFGDGATSVEQNPEHTYPAPGTYYVVATLHTPEATYRCFPTLRISSVASGVKAVGASPGKGLRLEPSRPNPFAGVTEIAFELPGPGHARLSVVDVAGRTVATLVNGDRPAGPQRVGWRGTTEAGREASAGLYLARLEYGGVVRAVRIVRLP